MQTRQFDKESKQLRKRRKERELVVRAVLDNVTLAQRKMVGCERRERFSLMLWPPKGLDTAHEPWTPSMIRLSTCCFAGHMCDRRNSSMRHLSVASQYISVWLAV